MGNEQSLERDQSVRIANLTEIPLVYVIPQIRPLYWGVLQPGERITRWTGRVWFTIDCYAYDGVNEPKTEDAVLATLVPILLTLGVVATGGWACFGAAAAAVPVAGTAQAALAGLLPLSEAPLVAGVIAGGKAAAAASAVAAPAHKMLVKKEVLESSLKPAHKTGHYANGDWIHVLGGPQKELLPYEWKSLHFVA